MPQLSVLVVDDEREVGELLETFLTQEGYAVRYLTDPTKAVSEFKRAKYHIVIVDLMMPKMNGLAVLAALRRIDDDVALVVLTGFPTLETATESISFSVSAYLSKPVITSELRETLRRIAEKKGLVQGRLEEMQQRVGRTIRDMRQRRRLSLGQLSRRTGMSVSLLSQIERAESNASVSTLFKIATAFGVRLRELFGEE